MQPRPIADTLRPLLPSSRSVIMFSFPCWGEQSVWRSSLATLSRQCLVLIYETADPLALSGPDLRLPGSDPAPQLPLWLKRLRSRWFRAEGPLGVALGATRPGQGA